MKGITVPQGIMGGFVLALIIIFGMGAASREGGQSDTLPVQAYIMNGTSVQAWDGASRVTLGTRTVHRDAKTANDTYTYGVNDTDKMNCTGFKYVASDIIITGTTPQADITPEFGDSGASAYTKGQKRTITQNERYIVEVDGEDELIYRIDGISGTNTTVTVINTPFN